MTRVKRPSVTRGEDTLLSSSEVAKILGVQPGTVRNWTYERRLPHVKLGRRVKYRASVVEKFIQDSEVRAISRSGEDPESSD